MKCINTPSRVAAHKSSRWPVSAKAMLFPLSLWRALQKSHYGSRRFCRGVFSLQSRSRICVSAWPWRTVRRSRPSLKGLAVVAHTAGGDVIGAIIINVLTFDLYGKVSKLIYKQMGDRLIAEQTVYYEKQLQMMKSLLDQMRILRHDLSNKLSPLLALSQENDMEKLQAAIQEILQYSRSDKSLVNSGNRDIDSILNFKLESGKQQGLKFSTDIIVPNAMEIESSDLAVILGNIIDNALEATLTVSDRWISVQIRYSKGRLIMEVVNSYDGIVKTDRDKLMTRKKERKDHGFGLNSVERVVDKYDGLIQTTYDDKTFKTKVLIYV